MKKTFLIALFLFSTPSFATMSVDELKENYELSNIYEADWYSKGENQIAESSNKDRDIKVSLNENKGSAIIKLKNNADFTIFAVISCYRLSNLIPHKASSSWGDEKTEDQKIIESVFTKDIMVGETKEAKLNNWNIKLKRIASGVSCSVSKG